MEHLIDCDFNERIKELKKGVWKSGDDGISGYVEILENKISFNDGWNIYPDINFIYCPICGVKI